MLNSSVVQAKLRIGKPNDKYEQEADMVAGRVMAMADGGSGGKSVQRQGDDEGLQKQPEEKEEAQAKPISAQITPLIQRQEEDNEVQTKPVIRREADEKDEPAQAKYIQCKEEEEVQAKAAIQREANEEEGAAQAKLIQHKEEEEVQAKPVIQREAGQEETTSQAKQIQRKDEDEVQAKSTIQREANEEEVSAQAKLIQRQEDEEELQTKNTSNNTPVVRSSTESVINTNKGGGQSLPKESQSFFESAFNHDFSQVRVHDGEQANQAAKSLNAQAFTKGNDIFFGAGYYQPGSSRGKKLLAHELTHTIHQNSGKVAGKQLDSPGMKAQRAESEAEDTAARAERAIRSLLKDPSKSSIKIKQELRQMGRTALELAIEAIVPDMSEASRKGLVSSLVRVQPAEQMAKKQTGPGADGPVSEKELDAKEIADKESKEKKIEKSKPKKTKPGKAKAPPAIGVQEPEGQSAEAGPEDSAGLPARIARSFQTISQSILDRGDDKLAAAKQRVHNLDENERSHQPVDTKMSQTKAAVKPPPDEGQSRANAKQVETVNALPAPVPDDKAAKNTTENTLNEIAPRSMDDVTEFKEQGKAAVLKGRVLQEVKKETTEIETTYEKVGEAPEVPSPEEETPPIPEPEEAEHTSALRLGDNVIKPLPKEATDFSPVSEEVDAAAKKEGLTDELWEQVDSGPLLEAREKRQEVRDTVVQVPLEIMKDDDAQRRGLKKDMKTEEKAARTKMETERTGSLGVVNEAQKEAKSAEEKERKEVTNKIQKMYQGAKTKVESKLASLETDTLKKFDKGQKKAIEQLENRIEREMDAFKDKRYSGIRGKLRWFDDLFKDLNKLPKVKAIFDNARRAFISQIDKLIQVLKKDANKVIEDCQKELKNANNEIAKFVASLKPNMQKIGQKAQTEMTKKLKALRKTVDKKAKDLNEKLQERREEAIRAADKKIQEAKDKLKSVFSRLAGLLKKAMIKFLKWVLGRFGSTGKKIYGILERVGSAIIKFVTNAPTIIKNLIKAVMGGVELFAGNFPMHMKNAISGWLFGTLTGAGITLPKTFNPAGIFSLAAQVLGLTYDSIKARIVNKLGSKGAALIVRVEQGVELVKEVKSKGPIVLWKKVQTSLSNLKETIFGAIISWAKKTIVMKAITKLATFFNPAGAVVQAIIAIYDVVKFFIDRWDQIKSFAKSIYESLSDIVAGNIGKAAKAVENTLAKGLVLIISFLARLVGLGGIAQKIKDVIKKIRAPIDKALDKVIDWIVKKANALFGKGKAAVKKGMKKGVEKVKSLIFPKKAFKAGKETHTVEATKSGRKSDIIIHSQRYGVYSFIKQVRDKIKRNQNTGTSIAKMVDKLEKDYDKWKKMEDTSDIEKKKKTKKYSVISKGIIKIWVKIGGPQPVPPTKVSFNSLDSDNRSKGVTADPLTHIPGNTTGSNPVDEIVGWTGGGRGRTREGLIRAHLLHGKSDKNDLHGPGIAKNMTPTSSSVNQIMYNRVEKFAIDAVHNNFRVLKYTTKVTYDDNQTAKKDFAKHIEMTAKDKETNVIIGSLSVKNY
ncbi:MAG: DUF4157 domain-containing protein [Deltaproteobacteria bacterium]|nr:DUF4157 domain-containing protein [Deltaproteobacteria bacterium]